ncbi:protein NDUFAF4 homolog [Tribolium madens]|uniref:protein NDUFAF4 homolog n=1 Tax=Tribolium madens TaxID=41895 RepID=UPI001CF72FF5|nr:protein NDUFAF4 homolog [Tribolium madens]XP_044259413.1 protein NDUFAF4 homolog [Tribolium madens]
MGKVMSMMGRPFRNFNIESRAHKIISKDKPTPAPKHKSDQLDYERLIKEYPQEFMEGQKKHEQLDNYLKDVYVTSHDPNPTQEQKINPDRPLPLNRRQVEDFEYGVKEPKDIPEGKATLKQILKFVTDHQNDHRLHSVEAISKEYKIPKETTKNVLKYFKVFEVYLPEQRKVRAKFAGPSVPRIRVTPRPRKQLPSGKEDKGDT